jgi:hypothetical protein
MERASCFFHLNWRQQMPKGKYQEERTCMSKYNRSGKYYTRWKLKSLRYVQHLQTGKIADGIHHVNATCELISNVVIRNRKLVQSGNKNS